MIKFDLAKIVDVFYASRRQRVENVATYVKKIAVEADELANIWEEIVNSIMQDSKINREKLISLGAHKYIPVNGMRYTRLQAFYQDTSAALELNQATIWVDDIVSSIGAILIGRDSANEVLLAAIKTSESSFFFDAENSVEGLKNLSASVNTIRKEAAALHVLASRIEAQKKGI